jgi:hypothetical protein
LTIARGKLSAGWADRPLSARRLPRPGLKSWAGNPCPCGTA